MSILSRLRAAFGRPPQQRGCAVTNGFFELHPLADPDWPSRAPAAYAREGYAQNPVAMRSIAMIAQCVAAVPLRLRHGARELSDHPLLRLLQRPNPLQSGPQLIEALISHMQIHGDGWLKVTLIDGEPAELVTLRPDKVRIITDEAGWPRAWEYRAGERAIRFAQSADDPVAPLFQLRTFSPLSDVHGLSPFSAAARAVDIHNAAARWSKALLDNAARPSGALVYRGEGGAGLSHEQFERLKSELESAYAGAANAGRPMVLEGGLEWTPLSHSPKDMEHIELRHAAARDIALAFGVPPMLLGIPGDNTYANYAEANRAFWRQT
ncbi:MAG TPA: phage portal protein, partial [Thermopetrobacter sp.]|nr:phage portal protein [Thermopetrobacter sp.]